VLAVAAEAFGLNILAMRANSLVAAGAISGLQGSAVGNVTSLRA
jgi:ABC-type branched-subunit amino acid transport system permease subunit